MKNFLLSLVALSLYATMGFAQTSVQLNIHHKLGESDFAIATPTTNNLNNDFNVSRLEYYISEISITHDGGTRTNITDLWILVDASEATEIDLGSHDITSVEMITFHIGVDEAHNHLDPASYASDHPLAPQLPSMHWGWSSGYRFVAYEGMAGNSLNQLFELHGLGDNNYFRTDVQIAATAEDGQMVLELNADYARALEDINLNGGLIIHGEFAEAKQVLENFRDYVFTPTNSTTSTVDFSEINRFDVFPNPAKAGEATIRVSSTDNQNYQVEISNLLGQRIRRFNAVAANTDLPIHLEDPGLYLVSLVKEGQTVLTQKLMVE